jgi:hypothetical protein
VGVGGPLFEYHAGWAYSVSKTITAAAVLHLAVSK